MPDPVGRSSQNDGRQGRGNTGAPHLQIEATPGGEDGVAYLLGLQAAHIEAPEQII